MKNKMSAFCVWVLAIALCGAGLAEESKPLTFANARHTCGDFTLEAAEVGFVTDRSPREVTYTLENRSGANITAELVFYSADTVKPLDEKDKPIEKITRALDVAAGSKETATFRFAAFDGTYDAHYPLHLIAAFTADGKPTELHAVRVIDVKLPAQTLKARTTEIKIARSLLGMDYQAAIDTAGKNRLELGRNLTGSDPQSRASVQITQITCGETRQALSVHPPYVPVGGSLWLDYPVTLPVSEKISFSYGCAIRTPSPSEPPSDGVTFRVWFGEEENKTLVDEIHTDSKVWIDRIADLSPFAGKTGTLTLEFNPGPQNNTTCDSCSMSGLVVSSQAALTPTALERREIGEPVDFALDNGFTATVAPGENGVYDGKITLKSAQGTELAFNGLTLTVGAESLSGNALFSQPPTCIYDPSAKRLSCRAEIIVDDRPQRVTLEIYEANEMLILDTTDKTNPAQMRMFELGGASVPFQRIYAGHGFVIENLTERFSLGGGGHELATSHVGADYANGLSVLIASETAPSHFIADPENQLVTLSVVGPTKLAILPSQKNAFDAAFQFRDRSPWKAAPSKGVARKAGRLVFDVWGGSYAANLHEVERAFQYGVTDSLFIKHVWQRWGYDVRLPDIWGKTDSDAVLPDLGTLDELRALCRACVSRHVPFALHDNYIDFYPDADEFSYRFINFSGTQPRKAWINHGKQVQSYQWRPDLIAPFIDRNMKLAKKYLPEMDAYFVDVFTSIYMLPFETQDGVYNPPNITQACWKGAFEQIGEALSHEKDGAHETAITMSEAGDDFLVGSIDGADAQWIGITQTPRPRTRLVRCGQWSWTPWFSAVNQTNFSRHGAGYEERYCMARDAALHGILSDDYISTELLGGVELMTDAPHLFSGAVRKHYLAQHIVRSRANAEIASVEFMPDDDGSETVLRQKIVWTDGTTLRVNRGETDWRLSEEITLPQYGFLAENSNGMISAIVRNPARASEVVEYSARTDGSFYLNGRGNAPTEIYAVTPRLASGEALDGGKFKIALDWVCAGSLPKSLSTFVHVFEPYRGYGHTPKGWYAGGSAPEVPTDRWGTPGHETVRTDETTFSVPADIPSGTYHVMVGLFDRDGGKRYPLMGEYAGETRYSVASLKIERSGENVKLTLEPVPLTERSDLFRRALANTAPCSYRGVETLGALAVTPSENTWTLLPLPTLETFDVTLNEAQIGHTVSKITADGADVPFTRDGNRVTFRVTAHDAVQYKVAL